MMGLQSPGNTTSGTPPFLLELCWLCSCRNPFLRRREDTSETPPYGRLHLKDRICKRSKGGSCRHGSSRTFSAKLMFMSQSTLHCESMRSPTVTLVENNEARFKTNAPHFGIRLARCADYDAPGKLVFSRANTENTLRKCAFPRSCIPRHSLKRWPSVHSKRSRPWSGAPSKRNHKIGTSPTLENNTAPT